MAELTSRPTLLLSDRPPDHPRDDRLGFAPFARHLADSLLRMAPADGFVVGLYGPWGSGKSTLLNFITHFLRERGGDDAPVVVRFNPWWFSGAETLPRKFFEQIQAQVGSNRRLPDSVRNQLGALASAYGKTPLPGHEAGSLLGSILPVKHREVTDLKESLARDLARAQVRIVVAVEDIDRLLPDEVREMFRLIKAVA